MSGEYYVSQMPIPSKPLGCNATAFLDIEFIDDDLVRLKVTHQAYPQGDLRSVVVANEVVPMKCFEKNRKLFTNGMVRLR